TSFSRDWSSDVCSSDLATRTFTWKNKTYRNHNRLLFRYQGLDGMKTGYIRASGFNLMASARRGKKHVLVAYFGGRTASRRNKAEIGRAACRESVEIAGV